MLCLERQPFSQHPHGSVGLNDIKYLQLISTLQFHSKTSHVLNLSPATSTSAKSDSTSVIDSSPCKVSSPLVQLISPINTKLSPGSSRSDSQTSKPSPGFYHSFTRTSSPNISKNFQVNGRKSVRINLSKEFDIDERLRNDASLRSSSSPARTTASHEHHCHHCNARFSTFEDFELHQCFSGRYGHVGWPKQHGQAADYCHSDSTRQVDAFSAKSSEAGSEAGSVSSGRLTPPGVVDTHRARAGRKPTAPRRVVIESMLTVDDDVSMGELDASLYDSRHDKSLDEPQALDMSLKRPDADEGLVTSPDTKFRSATAAGQPSSSRHSVSPQAVSKSQQNVNNHNGLADNLMAAPSYGVRIGDMISAAIASCHTNDYAVKAACHTSDDGVKAMNDAMFPSLKSYVPSSPKMKAKMYAKMYQSAEMNNEPIVVKPDSTSDEPSNNKNYIATDTGTYQITTEHVEHESCIVPDSVTASPTTGAGSKVIKVVKQGNYLKLKKEAHVIDGELRFVCPHCNKLFHRSSNFSRHMRIHRGVYSYICSTCQRGFYRKEHYDKHKCYRKSMASTWERKTKVDMDGCAAGASAAATPEASSHCADAKADDVTIAGHVKSEKLTDTEVSIGVIAHESVKPMLVAE